MEDSGIARIWGVLVSPTSTFRAIATKPSWVVPLLLLMGIGLAGAVLLTDKMDWDEITRESILASGRDVPEDQLEGIVEFQEKAGPIFMIGGSVVLQPVIFLLLALVFLVTFKVLGGELNFVSSFSVILHGLMPRAVMGLLSIPVILGKSEFGYEELRDNSVLTSNLASFAPDDAGPALIGVLSSIDVFSLWALGLLIVGYATVAKVSKASAGAGVIGLWIVYVLGKVGLASLGG